MNHLAAFHKICKLHGYEAVLITSSSRDQSLVKQRHHVAREMSAMGFSYPLIGVAMNRDQSTIQYMVKEEFRGNKKANMRHYAKEKRR